MLKVGAVIYSPNVTIIWDIIAKFCKEQGCEIEPVFFKDYKMQVDALMDAKIDIAWNSPLAWLDTHLRTKGANLNGLMRDSDQDRHSVMLGLKGTNLADLKGKKIGFGAIDSPQARLIPIGFLRNSALEFGKDYEEVRFDVGVGLHGDHVGGEEYALNALIKGEVAASWMLDLNYEKWLQSGKIDPNKFEIIAKTPYFDHCIFCGRVALETSKFDNFNKTLKKMDYQNPAHKEMMDLEGLKKWVDGRLSGFKQITAANEYLGFLC
ncbi:MAG: PhnD/SsuA/transferrin family substrate-binding protein [Campylobacter sp.]|nr:PhnD/SsuA/transferrin family substrate-binding protein [Campylobacter sp.]